MCGPPCPYCRSAKYALDPASLWTLLTFAPDHQSIITDYYWKAGDKQNMPHTLFAQSHAVLTEIQGSLFLVQCVQLCLLVQIQLCIYESYTSPFTFVPFQVSLASNALIALCNVLV